MFEALNQTTDAEKVILRKLRVWIAALAAVCIVAGIGIGAILAGRTAVAQNGLQAASRAPEALVGFVCRNCSTRRTGRRQH